MSGPLASYYTALRRRWRLVAAIPLLFVIAAAAALLTSPVEYRSTAVLFVSTPRDDAYTAYQGDLYSKERMNTYIALSKSPDLAAKVAEDVGQDVTAASLIENTELAAVPGTVLLSLTTVGTTPQTAQAIAQAYVDQMRRSVAALEAVPGALTPRAELIPVQPPTFSDSPGTFPPWLLLGAAGGLGLAIGGFVAVIAELLDSRIRRPEDASEATGSPVLASFPSTVAWERPDTEDWAAEAGRQLRAPLDRMKIQRSRVIFITSAESGAGKTGVALTVCRALADRGSSVALVDCDSRNSRIATALRLTGTTTSVRALVADTAARYGERRGGTGPDGRHPPPRAALHVEELSENWNGVVVVPFGLEEEFPGATADSPFLEPLFAELREAFEWIVVDSPPVAETSDAVRLAHLCDAVLIVAKAGLTNFDQLRSAAADLASAGGHIAGVVFLGDAPPRRGRTRSARERVVADIDHTDHVHTS
ncbi:Wzz/FepE/Etk N-terminal domain-containing protein [Mycobacterium sp. CPCC 205372]|uniref:Wzz/FepE/Etk N-terminal domain-containing protein n=1 Tax=Mycobacterium hippophais TaxID=3016340 RepID=A0ABT4PS08_9MYCO|nr:polysaccharide biosynthesis tyrosine autokinase [Mycobacterium hippophais]MCZ8379266.1 Wzz/FepE/Etk N-terminal domain-containing protein [Mycobacterium hippophais]